MTDAASSPAAPSVLFVPICTDQVAAARTRVYSLIPALGRAGFRATVFPCISAGCTREMLRSPTYSGLRKLAYYIRLLSERLLRFPVLLFHAARHDAVCLQRVTFPFHLERLLRAVNPNIAFDFDDAIFLLDPDAQARGGPVTKLKAWSRDREVGGALSVSKIAIVENAYLAAYAKKHCPDVRLVYGPIDLPHYRLKADHGPKEETTIGWIGSPSTVPLLAELEPVLRELARRHRIRLMTVGGGPYSPPDVPSRWKEWRLCDEASDLCAFDIGVMPMPDNAWTRGKTGHKMLQYMASGVPAVVSWNPTLEEFVRDGENGMFARTPEEWLTALTALIENPARRLAVGLAGRRTIEQRCSVEVAASVWSQVVRDLAR